VSDQSGAADPDPSAARPADLDPEVLDDFLDMVGDGLRPGAQGTRPAAGDYTGRLLEAQMGAYEALGHLGNLLRDATGLPSVLHPSTPDRLPEQWMDWARQAMESLVDASTSLGQAARAHGDDDG
jgi:hypothetical protein